MKIVEKDGNVKGNRAFSNNSDELKAQITERIRTSHLWGPSSKISGGWISQLVCPECQKAEMYTGADAPFFLFCSRGKCGARIKTTDLFPDLVRSPEKSHPATKENPDAPAEYYLRSRGLNESLKGLEYRYESDMRKGCGGGIMFRVDAETENGRIFSPPKGRSKTHNTPGVPIAGKFWKHPAKAYDPLTETFVAEGIVDALSLCEAGFQAIAVLSSNYDPKKFDLSDFRKLTFLFDNDPAGHKALKKWKAEYPDADALMLPGGQDFNDFLQQNHSKPAERFEKNRELCRFNADLALAEDAEEYAEIWKDFKKNPPGLFVFDGAYHFGTMTGKGETRKLSTFKISDFTVKPLYVERNEDIELEPMHRYALEITPEKGRKKKVIASANELAKPGALTTMFLAKGRVFWEGSEAASKSLIRGLLKADVPTIRQLDTVGYDEKTGCYIFKDFMTDPDGKVILPDASGFFHLSHRVHIRPSSLLPMLRPEKGLHPREAYELLAKAWGDKARAAVAWEVASFFVHEIKDEVNFFPVLSMHGESQTGKTTLLTAMNNFQCIDEEGVPMNRASTNKSGLRKLSQISGMFRALLESNRKADKIISWMCDTVLTIFNKNYLYSRADKTNDNRTRDLPFRGALAFIQNREPFETKAQKERILSLPFAPGETNADTTAAFDVLQGTQKERLAYFFPFVMQHRRRISEAWHSGFLKARDELREVRNKDGETINNARITETHGLVLAFHRLLSDILGVSYDLKPYIRDIAIRQHRKCTDREETTADLLFELLIELRENTESEDMASFMDVRKKEGMLWIHLPGTLKAIENHPKTSGILKTSVAALYEDLREHPAFDGNGTQSHRFAGAKRKAWAFDMGKVWE